MLPLAVVWLLACVVHAFGNGRPWFMQEASVAFVNSAVRYRRPGLPPGEASVIAGRIIDGALEPPQVTPLAFEVSRAVMRYGTMVPGPEALSLANMALNAYQVARQSIGFNNYLSYVSSNSHNFNFKALQYNPSRYSLEILLREALMRLQDTAEGREALSIAEALGKMVEHDAGVNPIPIPNRRPGGYSPPPIQPQPLNGGGGQGPGMPGRGGIGAPGGGEGGGGGRYPPPTSPQPRPQGPMQGPQGPRPLSLPPPGQPQQQPYGPYRPVPAPQAGPPPRAMPYPVPRQLPPPQPAPPRYGTNPRLGPPPGPPPPPPPPRGYHPYANGERAQG